MKSYDMECPVCGRLNRRLYLDETDGWMECEHCGAATCCFDYPERTYENSRPESICIEHKAASPKK